MSQDIIVNLAVGCSRDPELTGIAFCYEPVIVTAAMDAIPADFIEAARRECQGGLGS